MEQSLSQKSRQERLIRNVLFIFFVGGFATQPLGAFIPVLREVHGFDYHLTGGLLSVLSLGNIISVLTAGILPTFLGRRTSIFLFQALLALSYALMALGFGSPFMLLVIAFLIGIGRGGSANFGNTMMTTLPPEESARGFNLLHASYAIGALVSPLLLIGCTKLSQTQGWRIAAWLIFAVCLAQLVLILTMRLPEEKVSRSFKTVDLSFFRAKSFRLTAAMLFFYIAAEYAIMGWLVSYFEDIGALSRELSQFMGSLIWAVMLAGRLFGARLSEKVSKRRLLLMDGIGFAVFFIFMFFSRTTLPILIGVIGSGLFMATIYPTALSFAGESIKGNDLGAGVLIFTGTTGGIIAPAAVGFVSAHAGISAGIGVVVLCILLLLCAILTTWFSTRSENVRG